MLNQFAINRGKDSLEWQSPKILCGEKVERSK